MPREFHRSRRVEEQILRLLAELVRREVKDPRVGLVTLTAVEVSRDLGHAKVYFLPFEAGRDIAEVGAALASAAGFLRSQLRRHLQIRQVPELHFVPDESIDRAARLSALIDRAVGGDAARRGDAAPDGDESGDPDDRDDRDDRGDDQPGDPAADGAPRGPGLAG